MLRGGWNTEGNGLGIGDNKVEKAKKVEKWKTIKIPEDTWRAIKVAAAQKGLKIYEELSCNY